MAKRPVLPVGGLVRRNRRIARIQRIQRGRVHIRILMDVAFRVYDEEVVDLDDAPALLRPVPEGFYSSLLYDRPERFEALLKENAVEIMRLILCEHASSFGKREFKQILVKDDGAVPEEKWSAFWNQVYRGMRTCEAFSVDEKGRYGLV